MNKEEQVVQYFYDTYGWVNSEGISGEDMLFRRFSPPYYSYHAGVDARTTDCFSNLNGKLLLAGGGDLPESHISIANKFSETTCLDISKVAIEIARNKLEGQGEFIVGSILNIPTPSNYFDACFSAHVIYHIEKNHQAGAIRELIRVIKPGGRIVVIYRNPDALPYRLFRLNKRLRLDKVLRRKKSDDLQRAQSSNAESPPPLYYFAHPLKWWTQFRDESDVEIKPWDVMSNEEEEVIFLNDSIASLGYQLCSWLESEHPNQIASWWSYPLIVLTKKNGGTT